MIKNIVKKLGSEQELIKTSDIVNKSKTEKYFYINGLEMDTVETFFNQFSFNNGIAQRLIWEAFYDDFTSALLDHEQKTIIIISNFGKMRAAWSEKYKRSILEDELLEVFEDTVVFFEEQVVVAYRNQFYKKSVDIYVTDEDVNFEALKQR